MKFIELQFVSGNVFFIGMAMLVATSALYLRQNGIFIRIILMVSFLTGVGLVILSATPLSLWLYRLWLMFCLSGLILSNITFSSGKRRRYRLGAFTAITLACLTLTLVEFPHRFTPRIAVSPNRPIYVIGDSIGAGIGAERMPWPGVLGELAQVKVTNLARPGATAKSALTQAANIAGQPCFIIVEIGGNDMISGTAPRAFYDHLDQLLGKLCSGDNQVIMLELPLFPFHNTYGETQRTLAKKYGVVLLPKKFFTNIFGLPDALLADGLHFTQVGHDAMAKQIYGTLSFQ